MASPYIIGGIAQGVGQGVREGVGTMVARRKEEQELRRQREKDERDERRIRLAEERADREHQRSMLKMDIDFTEGGGVIDDDPTDNGTGRIGFQVGVSSATTQPSEHQGVPMREVGRAGGKRYMLPADGLKPADRLKQQGRQSRASAVGQFRYYKPTQADLDLLDDPEQGDAYMTEIAKRDWALNPANISAQAQVAGARAAATAPYKNQGSEVGADGLTAAQRAVQARTDRALRVGQARLNETQARQDIAAVDDPKKDDYGYDEDLKWGTGSDSTGWAAAQTRAHAARTDARLRAAAHGAEAESEVAGEDASAAARRKRRAAYQAYLQSFKESLTPEQRREAERLYRQIERETLAVEGRVPTVR